jgi:hypothetical protein
VLAFYRELFAGLSTTSCLTSTVHISLFVVTITPEEISGQCEGSFCLSGPLHLPSDLNPSPCKLTSNVYTSQVNNDRPTCLLKNRELRHLIATAKTEDDHRRLAAYYRRKTELLARKAQGHAEGADA